MPRRGRKATNAPKRKSSGESEVTVTTEDATLLSPQEQQVVNDAVRFINDHLDRSSVSMLEIGEYIIKTFFDGDVDKVASRAPRKGISLRKLADHPDLMASTSTLSRAVALAAQDRQLATVASMQHLSATHKMLLLSVDGLKDKNESERLALKEQYITRVEDENLSVAGFRKVLIANGLVKQRGLPAGTERGSRKEIGAGELDFLSPLQSIIEFDLDRINEMSEEVKQSIIGAINVASIKLDQLMKKINIHD